MKKNIMSTLLTLVGSVGVVATAILAVKATPKALKMIEEASGYVENGVCGKPLNKVETFQLCWKCYIPTAIVGAATISCICGANILSKRAQASLMSAYALLERSYQEYTQKVKVLYGHDADANVKKEIMLNQDFDTHATSSTEEEDDDNKLFFDFATLQYFRAPMSDVIQKVELGDGMECYIIASPFDNAESLF